MSKCVHAVWIWHRVLRVSGDGCGLGGGGPRRLRHLLAGVQNRGDVRTAAEDAEQLVSEKHAHSQRLMESTARKDAYCFAQLIQPHGIVDVLSVFRCRYGVLMRAAMFRPRTPLPKAQVPTASVHAPLPCGRMHRQVPAAWAGTVDFDPDEPEVLA